MRFLRKDTLFVSTGLLALFILAPVNPARAESGDALIRQQQERLEQQHLERTPRGEQHTITPQQATPPQGLTADDNLCFQIDTIDLVGAHLIPANHQQALFAEFMNSCMGLTGLDALQRKITAYYLDHGYVTTRAYLPQQDLSDAQLLVEVLEGRLEGVGFTDPAANTHLFLHGVMPSPDKALLNIRDIEQGLDQLNRLPSNRAKANFLPGDLPGTTLLQIENQPDRRYRITTGYDNSGQISTGERQLSLFVDIDSPLGYNGYFYTSYQGDTEQDQSDGRRSKSVAIHYDIPWGYWLFSADANWFEYLTTVEGFLTSFESTGQSRTQRLGLTRVIYRDGHSKWSLDISLARKKSLNFIEDTKIETASRTLAVAAIAVQVQWYRQSGDELSSSLTYHRGLDWLGAIHDDHQPAASPVAQFDRYSLALDYKKPFQIAAHPWQWRSTLKAQYSPDILYGTEQFTLGSQYSVRAYKDHGLSGNNGIFLRNELSMILQPDWASRWQGRVQPVIGFDLGDVQLQTATGSPRQSLKGWFAGLNWHSRHLDVALTYSQPIASPGFLKAPSEAVYFRVNIKF